MSSRQLPAHGTYARANGSPGRRPACNCEPCTRTRRRTKKIYRLNGERGQHGIVDAAPARQHLNLLHTTMSWSRIISEVGCAADTLFTIYNGTRARITRRTQDAILAVKPSYTVSGGLYIDSTGSTRRLQALQAAGHSLKKITHAMPHASAENVRLAARGERPRIRASFAAKIAKAYEALRDQPGDERVANRALALGYLPPHVWDADIDDPQADPQAGAERSDGRSRSDYSRGEQLDLTKTLTLAGRSAAEIAELLNVSSRTIIRWRTAGGWKAAA